MRLTWCIEKSINSYRKLRYRAISWCSSDNTDHLPIPRRTDLETYLLNRSTLSAQTLIRTLFTLPLTRGPLGPTATLPPSTSHSATSENSLLPREKPLPKPKPPTKWERFAKEKGISKTRKDKKVWDEELQDWVDRWGRHGKNKGEEEAWIRVIKSGEGKRRLVLWSNASFHNTDSNETLIDADHDPIATSRAERKARIAKNKSQQLRNLSEAAAKSASPSTSTLPPKSSSAGGSSVSAAQKAKLRDARKKELERSLLLSKGATASMGKFDKKLEGEPKIKGVKRKVRLVPPCIHCTCTT